MSTWGGRCVCEYMGWEAVCEYMCGCASHSTRERDGDGQ